MRTRFFSLVWVAALLVLSAAEAAAEPFVVRPMTLTRSDWRFDFGLGLGHVDREPGGGATGLGLNLEAAYGLTSFLQLGFRTGVRIGDDGRATQADRYGRLHETEHYGTAYDDIANPELSLRWALLYGRIAELALDARMYLPVEDGSRFGFMLGVPLWLHLGGAARLDSGVYLPVILGGDDDETSTAVSIPLHLWFQLSGATYLGALTGVVIRDEAGNQVPLGIAGGYAINRNLDFQSWFLFPDVSGEGSASDFGLGVGLEVRF